MTPDYKILSQETVYDGFFKLERYHLKHTLFNGGWSQPLQRELFRRSDCVGVLLYDPKRDEVVLLEQFRVGPMVHMSRPWLLEIVAGGIEAGETKEEVAHREAYEEAGCKIEALMLINEFYTSPGGSSELLSLYCGKVDSSGIGGIHGLEEESEDISVTTVSFDEVYQLLERGEIKSGIPIIAIQWLALNRDKLRAQWL
ncbi:MAG: NUDIX domain-containing protein [Methylococcales bacterium]|nr:NUDIX domain-containing protein [Methylococcales bacterium]